MLTDKEKHEVIKANDYKIVANALWLSCKYLCTCGDEKLVEYQLRLMEVTT